MKPYFIPFVFILFILFCGISESKAQTVQVNLGNDTTLPCGVSCLNLSATFTKAQGTSSYVLDSNLLFSNHYSFTLGSSTGIPIIDDQFSSLITLPFNFCFYGINYSQCVISTNGHISFNTTKANSTSYWDVNPAIPTSATSLYGAYYDPPSIMPAFHDLYNPYGGTITYSTVGTAPNRRFVVNWNQVPQYSCTWITSTFQAVLYEATNVIEFYIQDRPSCSTWQSGKAISGIFGSSTTAMAVPGKNATAWGSTGMNKAYRFTPSAAATPTVQLLSSTGSVIASATAVSSSATQMTAAFNNICLTTDSAFYIAKVTYPCNSTVVYDTIKVKQQTSSVPIVTSPVTYCEGATATPLTANGQNLLWYTNASGGTGSTTAPVPNTSIAGTQVYYVSQTINSCESNRDSIIVNIVSNPAPAATSNAPVCSGDSLKLFASSVAGAGYSWTGPTSFSSSSQNPFISNATTTNSGVYTVTTTTNGCTATASVTVAVNPSPVISSVTFLNPTSCGGSDGSITINGLTSGVTYSISYSKNNVPQTPLTFTATAGSVSITGLTAGSFTNISVSLNGCSDAYPGPVQLVDPNAPLAPAVSNNGPICEGTSLTLSASAVAGATYTWTGPNGFTSSAQNPVVANAQVVNSGNYSVAITVNNCTSTAAVTNAIVHPIPAAPLVNSNSPVCVGGSLNLSATSVSGASYNWTGPNSFSSSSQSSIIANVQMVNAGTYTATATLNGCTSPATTTSVTITPATTISSVLYSSPTTCGGTDGYITLSGLAAGTVYTVSYDTGSTTATLTLTANSSGEITIGNLTHNVNYTNWSVGINGCSPATIPTFFLNPPSAPLVVAISNNGPLCAGNMLNLSATATGASVTYSWSGPNGFSSTLQNPSVPAVTTANAGVYTVVAMENNCSSTPATTTVIVGAQQTISGISFTNPTSCNGNDGTITLSGLSSSTSFTLSYSIAGITQTPITVTSDPSGTIMLSGLAAATYSNFQVTINGCTSNIAGPVVLTNPAGPSQPTVTNNGPLCAGATLNLTATSVAGASYSWAGPNGFSSTAQNPTIPNVQAANAGTYSVTATLNNCTSTATTTNLIVNPTPVTPLISGTATLCEGSTIALLASSTAGASYSWSGPNGFSSTVQNPVINNATTAASGTYSVFTTLNGCNSATATASIVVNPTPTVPVVADITYCQFAAATPLSATGQNLLWYTSATGGMGNSNPPTPPTTTTGTYIWYVSQQVNGCESPRAAINVTVINKPSAPLVAGPVTYCQFATATALTASGQNLLWYTAPTGGTGLSTAPTPSTSTAGTFTWYVSQSVNGCESDRASITVSVFSKPDTPTVGNTKFCQGDPSASLNVQGQNLTWYTVPFGGVGLPDTPVITTSIPNSIIYYVSQTVNGCESDRSVVAIIVDEKVDATIGLNTSTVCQYDTISLSSNGVNPASSVYSWSFDGASVFSGSGEGPYKVRWLSEGTKTVKLNITNGACSDSDSTTITVKTAPYADFSVKSDACIDEVINVQAAWNSLNGTSYLWDFNGAEILTGNGPGLYRLRWKAAGDKILSLLINSNGCNSELKKDTITIHETPLTAIDALTAGESICVGDTITFHAQQDPSAGRNNYLWTPSDFFTENGLADARGKIRQPGFVHLTVTDPYGCNGSDSVYLNAQPCCDIRLPDAFTPNGDGKNDFFHIITSGDHQLSSFRIVNRWGQTVFETANENDRWDGTFGGVPQDMGTFFYYIRYQCDNNQTFEKKGEVILIR